MDSCYFAKAEADATSIRDFNGSFLFLLGRKKKITKNI